MRPKSADIRIHRRQGRGADLLPCQHHIAAGALAVEPDFHETSSFEASAESPPAGDGIGHVMENPGGFDHMKALLEPLGIQNIALYESHVFDAELGRHAPGVGQGAAAQIETQHPGFRPCGGDGNRFLAGATARCQDLHRIGQKLRWREVAKAIRQIITVAHGRAPG